VGLELLTAVVEEFSPSTASQMGLSWCALPACWPISRAVLASPAHTRALCLRSTSPLNPLPVALCRELHEQCRSPLEQGYLHGLLLPAPAPARQAAAAAASGADGGVCVAALRLLGAILGWPFSSGGHLE